MNRNLAGWMLITVGLAGIVGAAGMAYMFRIANETEVRNAQAEESMNPGGMPTTPRQSDSALQYGAAALCGAAGLVLVFWARDYGEADR